jgi:uncharacterized membrane protein
MAAFSDRVFPALRWKAITPTNDKTLEPVPAAIMVSVDGNVAMIGDDGVSATFPLIAGTVYPMQPIVISATGTTATGIIGLYN